MTPHRALLIAPLALLCACSTRRVDVNQGGHRMETLTARAEKSQGVWTMDMELPIGRWQVRLPEDTITPRVVEREGRPHARFDLPEGRIHDGRSIRLTLQALREDGEADGPVFTYDLSARIPGQGFVDFIFRLWGNASYKL